MPPPSAAVLRGGAAGGGDMISMAETDAGLCSDGTSVVSDAPATEPHGVSIVRSVPTLVCSDSSSLRQRVSDN